jgi:hypothetical protein
MMKLRSARCFFSLLLCLVCPFGTAWNIPQPQQRQQRHMAPITGLLSSATDTSESAASSSVLEGVTEFERWFAEVPGASRDGSIVHDDFGNLRGLACSSSLVTTGSSRSDWMTIPRSVVLHSDFSRPDWDAKLAQQLWQEVMKGPSSDVAGYVALLTQGSSWKGNDPDSATAAVPPSTASDALRHWSEEEKRLLSSGAEGQRLLGLEQQQQEMWRAKYNANSSPGMTYEQFSWAMEVVHSRAFCGDFGIIGGGGGSSAPSTAITVAAPVLAGVAGFAYYVPLHGQSDAVLLALAALAAVPILWKVLQQETPVAVLLPLIDSANHLEEADSKIEYSSVRDCFTLTGGSRCLLTEGDGNRPQLCISYGRKKDTELLLNYGFLRGVASEGDSSTRRRRLAETFLNQNGR